MGGAICVRPYVRLGVRGGSPYTASPRVARGGRADPHHRRTSRGPAYRCFCRDRRGKVAQAVFPAHVRVGQELVDPGRGVTVCEAGDRRGQLGVRG